MIARRHSTAPRPELLVAPGATVGGFTVDRVTRESDGRWTTAEATGPDGRPVLLHVSTLAAAANAGQAERIDRLARLCAAEDLPLVAPVAAGRDGDRLFFARARPEGLTTLAERLRQGPLERDEAVRLLSQVAGGLETLRGFAIPHATLTPAHIAITTRRPIEALVADYGFGPPAGRACEQPVLLEAADYLAPEIAQGAPFTPAANVYALACILVEALTGAPPYPYASPLLVLQAHLTEEPPRLSERADLPRELDGVVETALRKRPEHRPGSVAGLMRATQRAVGRPSVPIRVIEPAPDLAPAPPKAAAEPPRPTPPPQTTGRGHPAAKAKPAVVRRPAPDPQRRDRPRARRRLRWPAPAGVGVCAALLVASTAGFATASLQTTSTDATPPAAAPAQSAPATSRPDPRSTYLRAVDRAMVDLRRQRATHLEELRSARSARAQATAVTALTEAYKSVSSRLPAEPRSVAGARQLPARLAATEHAYRLLARAAQHRDASAYRAARAEVVAQELGLTRELRRLAG